MNIKLPDTNEHKDLTNHEADLAAYYSNRKLLVSNILFIIVLSLGWSACFTFIGPLMKLGTKAAGVSDSVLGFISGANSWVYSYLVMYFAWKSDNTVSRFGRRIPFLMISAPVIVISVALFPFFSYAWILVGLSMIQATFMDIKAATIPLLNIDCVPRHLLARINSLSAIVFGITNFFAMRYGMKMADYNYKLPFLLAALFLALTTLIGIYYIKEPPIKHKSGGRFLPWSAMKVALKDKRVLILMLGVGLIQGACMMGGAWIWLYANRTLGISLTQLGKVMSWGVIIPIIISYPAGWLIDKYQGIRMVAVYWGLSMLTAWWMMTQVHDSHSIIIATMLMASAGVFYGAADIKVYRNTEPEHIGSVTSTNSSMKGIIIGH